MNETSIEQHGLNEHVVRIARLRKWRGRLNRQLGRGKWKCREIEGGQQGARSTLHHDRIDLPLRIDRLASRDGPDRAVSRELRNGRMGNQRIHFYLFQARVEVKSEGIRKGERRRAVQRY